MSYLGTWQIDDLLVFPANTHTAATGAATDADSVPTYRVYEDETSTPLLTGSMAKLDDANTIGFYSEQITLSAANGFEVGKSYTVYITATVATVTGTLAHTFQVEEALATAAAIATAVWASGTRTLTSFGTLIADIWAYVARTLTQTAAQVTASVTGSDLTIVRAVTFTATLTGLTIPATWSKVYFTAKQHRGAADTEAVVQIVVSNPAAPLTDGLLRINRAAGTLANGSLVVSQVAGTVAITLADDASTLLISGAYVYDLKALLSDGTSQLITAGSVTVADTVTEAIT